jgi:WD40 repeat protein
MSKIRKFDEPAAFLVHGVYNDTQSPLIVVDPNLSMSAVSSSRTMLATANNATLNGEIKIWNTQTNALIQALPSELGSIQRLLFSTDDQRLFVFSNNSFRSVDTTTWQPIYRLAIDATRSALAADDQTVAIMVDSRIKVLPIANPAAVPQPLYEIKAPSAFPDSIGLSPDGRYAVVIETNVSGGSMWDSEFFGPRGEETADMTLIRVANGAIVQRFRGSPGSMGSPCFTRDGQTITW